MELNLQEDGLSDDQMELCYQVNASLLPGVLMLHIEFDIVAVVQSVVAAVAAAVQSVVVVVAVRLEVGVEVALVVE